MSANRGASGGRDESMSRQRMADFPASASLIGDSSGEYLFEARNKYYSVHGLQTLSWLVFIETPGRWLLALAAIA